MLSHGNWNDTVSYDFLCFSEWPEFKAVHLCRHNICTELVQHLYKIDTPTNVMPSLHVFNSVMCCTAIWESRSLRKNKLVRWGSWVLTVLIIAATMFLKQHTILDVVVALAMGRICWFFMYRYKVQTVVEYEEV